MVVDEVDQAAVDRIFAALADATRRDIVTRVLREEASVSTLARAYAMSFAAVQKHVAVLERAGLVTKERRGREQLVRGDVATVRTAADLLARLEEIWRGRVDRMADLLGHEAGPADGAGPGRGAAPPSSPDTTREDRP
jgi:DNA-binding transcriptional ArsR family regulator